MLVEYNNLKKQQKVNLESSQINRSLISLHKIIIYHKIIYTKFEKIKYTANQFLK